jgi:hypothetical protein
MDCFRWPLLPCTVTAQKVRQPLLVLGSVAFAGYFAAKAVLHNRSGLVSNPEAVRWFANDGQALLFYARQPDGGFIFCSRPGFHYRTGQELKPVTAEIYKEWRQLKGLQDSQARENLMLREELVRATREAAQGMRDLEDRVRASEERAKERRSLAESLARQKAEAEEARREVEARLSATETNMQQIAALQQESGRRMAAAEQRKRELENKVQVCADKLVEGAKLSEELAVRNSEAERAKKELEARLQASEEKRSKQSTGAQVGNGNSGREEAGCDGGGQASGPAGGWRQRGRQTSAVWGLAAGPTAGVVIQVMNQTRYTAYLTFSAGQCRHVWPEPGRAFMVSAGQTSSISLAGDPGERVFFTAWAAENPYVRWGNCACRSGAGSGGIAVCGGAGGAALRLVENTRVGWSREGWDEAG